MTALMWCNIDFPNVEAIPLLRYSLAWCHAECRRLTTLNFAKVGAG